MDLHSVYLFGGLGLGVLLFGVLIALFFISRRSQRVMESMLNLVTEPDRARIQDASNVLQTIMADEIKKILDCFKSIQENLRSQIDVAQKLYVELGARNETVVNTANEAVQRVAQMSDRVDNTVGGLQNVIDSAAWQSVASATDRFASIVNDALNHISETTSESADKISQIDDKIDKWVATSQTLGAELQTVLDSNTESFQKMSDAADNMKESLDDLSKSVADGFDGVKDSAAGYENVMDDNSKILNAYLAKLDTFSKQSKKQLTSQMNTLTNTTNIISAQVLLSESSVDKQVRKLTDAVEAMMTSATETESAVRGISTELSGLTNHFENEIKDFAGDVVAELKTVSGVADKTLQDTKTSANAFSESVKSMATGVRETLIEMNAAHTQLTGQSQGLIKMSVDTTEQLKPLSELIEKYYTALPDLVKTSSDAGLALTKTVAELDEKIAKIRDTVSESTVSVSESAVKLDDLAGQSRQQMIDLMSDYAKAVDTMQTLNKQMMVARAAAPMEAIKTGTASMPVAGASSRDFLAQSTHEFDKMYEQSVDLTRAMGGEIPDVVWKKYHAGDKTIFAKWLAKMVKASDKKHIKDLLKSDSVFRSQATQFVRAFDKIVSAAKQTDTPDKLIAMLIKTDLGMIYSSLVQYV